MVIKVMDFLVITPLRLRSFYSSQGVNCVNWHPFHFLMMLRRGQQKKQFLYAFRELFLSDPDTKAYFLYWGTNPTLILNRTEQIKELTQTKEA